MCLPWSISIIMTHNLAQNAFLIYTGFSASNGGHFSVYSTTFLPFFERKFDAYLRQICLFDAYLRRSGGFMCQMTVRLIRRRGRSREAMVVRFLTSPFSHAKRQTQLSHSTVSCCPYTGVQQARRRSRSAWQEWLSLEAH